LNETGFIEGRNVTIEFRFGYNDNARLPELAADAVFHMHARAPTLLRCHFSRL